MQRLKDFANLIRRDNGTKVVHVDERACSEDDACRGTAGGVAVPLFAEVLAAAVG